MSVAEPAPAVPEHLTIQVTQIARYRAFAETAGGFELPTPQSSDRHIQFSLPGAVALPAVLYYRTRHAGQPAFSVRLNETTLTQYAFVPGDEAERTWHEIVPATSPSGPVLRPDANELTFFARDGSVVFGDVVLLYTANATTIPVSIPATGRV